jgi:hypothetical protein
MASRNLDEHYLPAGIAINADTRMHALTAFLADVLVDTGELNLDIGRVPDVGRSSDHDESVPRQTYSLGMWSTSWY